MAGKGKDKKAHPRPAVVYHAHDEKLSAVYIWCKGKIERWKAYRDWAKHRAKNSHAPDRGRFRRSQQLAERKYRWLQKHREHVSGGGSLLMTFDGKTVPHWIGVILQGARNRGVKFTVLSGVRSPEQSIGICEDQCGQPFCPGTCAGAASNHAMPPSGTGVEFEGAVDIWPGAQELQADLRAHNEPLIGGGVVLPNDPNHFSHLGN